MASEFPPGPRPNSGALSTSLREWRTAPECEVRCGSVPRAKSLAGVDVEEPRFPEALRRSPSTRPGSPTALDVPTGVGSITTSPTVAARTSDAVESPPLGVLVTVTSFIPFNSDG